MRTWDPDFDFYVTLLEERPMGVLVDLNAVRAAPVEGLSERVLVRVAMRSPRSDGLRSAEETLALNGVERVLVSAMEDAGALFVGRVMFDGNLDFVFMAAPEYRPPLPELPDYPLHMHAGPDPEWRFYLTFLFPDPYTRHHMLNRRVRKALLARGDDPGRARTLDHQATFPLADAPAGMVDKLVAAGFTIARVLPSEHDIVVHFAQVSPVDAESVDSATDRILDVLGEHHAAYDGWGCSVKV